MLYYFQNGDNHIITHDGFVQLGSLHCTVEWFLEHAEVEVCETYWLPDTFGKRYPRPNYQRHVEAAGKDKLE